MKEEINNAKIELLKELISKWYEDGDRSTFGNTMTKMLRDLRGGE